MSSSSPSANPAARGWTFTAARTWSFDDIRRLRELAGQGLSVEIIAARLRKSPSAVRNKAGMHGISLKGARAAAGTRLGNL